MARTSEPQGGRLRTRTRRHPGPLGRHPGRLLVGLALTLLTITTAHVITLGARSAGVALMSYMLLVFGWAVIDR